MSNSLKFTFKGSIELVISDDQPHAELLKISVRDTGIGIPENV